MNLRSRLSLAASSWLLMHASIGEANTNFIQHVGNGGGLVQCAQPNDGGTTLELLDFYEGKRDHGISPRIPDVAGLKTPLGLVKTWLHALERHDYRRYLQFQLWLETFFDETEFVGESMEVIADTGYSEVPLNCVIVQGAVQLETPDSPKRYMIDETLWQQLSIVDQAGLILHELVYREALQRGHTDSYSVRYFTALIATGYLADLDMRAYQDLLLQLRFRGVFAKIGSTRLWYLEDVSVDAAAAPNYCQQLSQTLIPAPGYALPFMYHADLQALELLLAMNSPISSLLRISPAARIWVGSPLDSNPALVQVAYGKAYRLDAAEPGPHGIMCALPVL